MNRGMLYLLGLILSLYILVQSMIQHKNVLAAVFILIIIHIFFFIFLDGDKI